MTEEETKKQTKTIGYYKSHTENCTIHFENQLIHTAHLTYHTTRNAN